MPGEQQGRGCAASGGGKWWRRQACDDDGERRKARKGQRVDVAMAEDRCAEEGSGVERRQLVLLWWRRGARRAERLRRGRQQTSSTWVGLRPIAPSRWGPKERDPVPHCVELLVARPELQGVHAELETAPAGG